MPRRVDLYFAGNLLRQALWSFIAFGIGFYSANTVSLSFGALAINDVVAAAITVAFCEVTTAHILAWDLSIAYIVGISGSHQQC